MTKRIIINIDSINVLLICLLSALIIFTPLYPLKLMIVLLGLLFLWILTTLKNAIWLKRAIPFLAFLMIAFILDLVSSLANNDSDILHNFLTQKLFVYIWAVVFCYYADKPNLLKKCIVPILIMILVSCYFTIMGNIQYPGASRMLASGNEINVLYHSLNIGGYDFVNGLIFLILPVVIYAKSLKKYKLLFIAIISVILGTIIIGSYTIAIFLSVAMLIMSVTNPTKKIRFALIMMIIIIAFVIFSDSLLDLMGELGRATGSDILVQRAQMIRYRNFIESSGENRFILYHNGLINFSNNVFFGKLLGDVGQQLASGHSALINYLESYGLFSVVYFKFWIDTVKFVRKVFVNDSVKYYYHMFFIVFMIFALINTIDTSNGIGFFVLFFGPALLLCADTNLNSERVN